MEEKKPNKIKKEEAGQVKTKNSKVEDECK